MHLRSSECQTTLRRARVDGNPMLTLHLRIVYHGFVQNASPPGKAACFQSDEYDVERYLRNSKGAVIYEGSREIHQLVQAQYEPLRCGLPAYDPEEWQQESQPYDGTLLSQAL